MIVIKSNKIEKIFVLSKNKEELVEELCENLEKLNDYEINNEAFNG